MKIDSEDAVSMALLLPAAEKCHEAVVQLLLEAGKVNPDLKGDNVRTPLSWATVNGHEAVVRLLLDKGAAVDSNDKHNRKPQSWAAVEGHEALVKLLKSHAL